jgi:hypothetical protein
MDRLLGFLVIGWVAVMAIGIVIALLPVIFFIVGFVGMMVLVTFIGRLVGSWFYF